VADVAEEEGQVEDDADLHRVREDGDQAHVHRARLHALERLLLRAQPEFGKGASVTWLLVSSLARFTKYCALARVSSDVVQVSRRVIGGPAAFVCATTGRAVGPTSAIAPSTIRVAAGTGAFHRVIGRSSPASGLEVG
jgi:hypothetical protein